MSQPSVTFICTAYNEGRHILNTLSELRDSLSAVSYAWEMVVINDGSSDNTAAEISQLGDAAAIRFIDFKENKGFGFCIRHGIQLARGDRIVWFPTHGMIVPASFVAQVSTCADDEILIFRIANPFVRPLWRVALSWVYVRLCNAMLRLDVPAYNVCVAFPSSALKSAALESERSFLLVEMIATLLRNGGLRWRASTMRMRRREHSRSKSFKLKNVSEIYRNLLHLRRRLARSSADRAIAARNLSSQRQS